MAAKDFRGFRLLESYNISPNVKRTVFRYDEQPNGGCGATLDILHVLTALHVFHLAVEVCQGAERQYDQEFAHRVFQEFAYGGKNFVPGDDLTFSPLWKSPRDSEASTTTPSLPGWLIGALTAAVIGGGVATFKGGKSLYRKLRPIREES